MRKKLVAETGARDCLGAQSLAMGSESESESGDATQRQHAAETHTSAHAGVLHASCTCPAPDNIPVVASGEHLLIFNPDRITRSRRRAAAASLTLHSLAVLMGSAPPPMTRIRLAYRPLVKREHTRQSDISPTWTLTRLTLTQPRAVAARGVCTMIRIRTHVLPRQELQPKRNNCFKELRQGTDKQVPLRTSCSSKDRSTEDEHSRTDTVQQPPAALPQEHGEAKPAGTAWDVSCLTLQPHTKHPEIETLASPCRPPPDWEHAAPTEPNLLPGTHCNRCLGLGGSKELRSQSRSPSRTTVRLCALDAVSLGGRRRVSAARDDEPLAQRRLARRAPPPTPTLPGGAARVPGFSPVLPDRRPRAVLQSKSNQGRTCSGERRMHAGTAQQSGPCFALRMAHNTDHDRARAHTHRGSLRGTSSTELVARAWVKARWEGADDDSARFSAPIPAHRLLARSVLAVAIDPPTPLALSVVPTALPQPASREHPRARQAVLPAWRMPWSPAGRRPAVRLNSCRQPPPDQAVVRRTRGTIAGHRASVLAVLRGAERGERDDERGRIGRREGRGRIHTASRALRVSPYVPLAQSIVVAGARDSSHPTASGPRHDSLLAGTAAISA
ncbi:hypothetical protein BD413DRAFT_495084 [Trametes elegans]|nr:hypothetical protein BD413DRAFT_495084 [Trametes elegans]